MRFPKLMECKSTLHYFVFGPTLIALMETADGNIIMVLFWKVAACHNSKK